MKRIFITGPTGAIGIALINHLVGMNHEVVAICRKNSQRLKNIPQSHKIKIVECDLYEINEHSEELGNGDYFFHLAWHGTSGAERNDLDLQLKNIQYTLDCLRLSKKLGCKKFVGIGSQAEYGIKNEKLTADSSTNPLTGYGIGKLCASYMSKIEAKKLKMEFNWVRILSIYGPYDGKHTLIMSLIDKMIKNQDIELTEGVQIWDYLYSEDAARALWLIAEKGITEKTYVLGSGSAVELKQYIEIINKIIPNHSNLLWGRISYTPQSIMYLCASNEELHADTGFKPETSFETGILNTYLWYKEYVYEKN